MTFEELSRYAESSLNIIGPQATAQAHLYQQSLAGTLYVIPDDAQALMMFSGQQYTLTAGDFAEIQESLAKRGGGNALEGYAANGYYSANDGTLAYVAENINDDKIFSHEQGHAIDQALGNFSESDVWKEAVGRELENRKFDPDRSAYALSILPESRTLSQHTSTYSVAETAKEAFAEMTNHYFAVFAQNSGDMEKVNEQLSKAYPDLWPVYKDEVLPRVADLAAQARAKAQTTLDDSIKIKEEFAKEMGMPFDHEAEAEKIRTMIIGSPAGMDAVLAESYELSRFSDKAESIKQILDKREEITELKGQQFDRAQALSEEFQSFKAERKNSSLLAADLEKLDTELTDLKKMGGDVARLTHLDDGIVVMRSPGGYQIRVNPEEGVPDEIRLTNVQEKLAAIGVKVDLDHISDLTGDGGGKLTIPNRDMPLEILQARQAAAPSDAVAELIRRSSTTAVADVADAALAPVRVEAAIAEEAGGWVNLFRKMPWIGPAAAAAAAPIIVLATGGSAAEAAESAVPGMTATEEGRPLEAGAQIATGLVDGAAVVVAITGATAAAPALTVAATVVAIGNEAGRPLLRLAGLDVDPSLGEQAVTALYEGISHANQQQLARLQTEMSAGELKAALLDEKSPIHEVMSHNFAVEYGVKIARIKKANDGELPARLPDELQSEEAYVAARMSDTITPLSQTAAMTPTGVEKSKIDQALADLKTCITGGDEVGEHSGACHTRSQAMVEQQRAAASPA